jgi:hypothetical protein
MKASEREERAEGIVEVLGLGKMESSLAFFDGD